MCSLSVTVESRPGPAGDPVRVSRYASGDARGCLQFAGRPRDAPVVRFDGPWTLSLQAPYLGMGRLTPGLQEEVEAGVGTPGVGAGTFAWVAHDGEVIPRDKHPVAEIEYPPAAPGDAPVTTRLVLKERC